MDFGHIPVCARQKQTLGIENSSDETIVVHWRSMELPDGAFLTVTSEYQEVAPQTCCFMYVSLQTTVDPRVYDIDLPLNVRTLDKHDDETYLLSVIATSVADEDAKLFSVERKNFEDVEFDLPAFNVENN